MTFNYRSIRILLPRLIHLTKKGLVVPPKTRRVVPSTAKKKTTTSKKSSSDEWELPGPNDLIKPSENFFDYYTVLHGTAGVGKSSLMASIPGSMIFQFEPERRNIVARQVNFRIATVPEMEKGAENAWVKFTTLLEKAENDSSIKVIGIDNISECYKSCENNWLLENDMESVPKKDFGASRSEITREFERVLNGLKYDSRLGVVVTAHTKEREGELNTGTTETMYSPACSSAVFEWLKKAMDFAFFIGYHNNRRAVHCRWDTIWTKCGVHNRFCTTAGKQLNGFVLPADPTKGYETLLKAWDNKLKTGIFQEQESE